MKNSPKAELAVRLPLYLELRRLRRYVLPCELSSQT